MAVEPYCQLCSERVCQCDEERCHECGDVLLPAEQGGISLCDSCYPHVMGEDPYP